LSPAKPRGVQDLHDIDLVFGALAHRSRRTILTILLARGGEMTSGAIAARFDCTWPTTTRHLRVLEAAGLVRVELQGRERVYRLDRPRLTRVAGGWVARFDESRTSDARPPASHG
jgi:DNA-binding transcriptional ArsR family regulator